jgi:hypothetical protein
MYLSICCSHFCWAMPELLLIHQGLTLKCFLLSLAPNPVLLYSPQTSRSLGVKDAYLSVLVCLCAPQRLLEGRDKVEFIFVSPVPSHVRVV